MVLSPALLSFAHIRQVFKSSFRAFQSSTGGAATKETVAAEITE
jgi:hypothetical protein